MDLRVRVVAVRTLMHFVKLGGLVKDNKYTGHGIHSNASGDKSYQARKDSLNFGHQTFGCTLRSVLLACTCLDSASRHAEENQILLDLLLEEYVDKFHDVQLQTLRILAGQLELLTQRDDTLASNKGARNEGSLFSFYVDILLRIQMPRTEAECSLYCFQTTTGRYVGTQHKTCKYRSSRHTPV